MNAKGFQLLDSLIALALLLLSVASISQLHLRASQSQNKVKEQTIAASVMNHVMGLVPEYVRESGDRFYDALGLPCKSPGKFKVKITYKELPGRLTWYITLSWRDWDGESQSMTTERIVWVTR